MHGEITPSGNKNSVLPIICASLLTNEPVTINNIPNITDVQQLVEFFQKLGSEINWDKANNTLTLNHSTINNDIDFEGYELPTGMRSSVLLYVPLLIRFKKIIIESNTKGCSLGVRELDTHFDALKILGAELKVEDSTVLHLPEHFKGTRYWLEFASVTTTENFILAAILAEGNSTLFNAASEPHVQDLCNFLLLMGAKITGIGTSLLSIEGVTKLSGANITINSDHHEIATFLAFGAITNGEVRVRNAIPHHFDLINRSFKKLGVLIEYDDNTAIVRTNQKLVVESPYTKNLLPKIEGAPWPYFPVDLLPIMVALSIRTRGTIQFWNKVYEGGFTWISELAKFGAHVVMSDPHRIIVFGDTQLHPAVVESPYIIRAAIGLLMIAASIPGESIVKNADIIRRAHPRFVENLQDMGAKIDWI